MSVDILSSAALAVLTAAMASCVVETPLAAFSISSAELWSSSESVFERRLRLRPRDLGRRPSDLTSSASFLFASETVVAASWSFSFVRLPPLSVVATEVRLSFHVASAPQRVSAYAARCSAADVRRRARVGPVVRPAAPC